VGLRIPGIHPLDCAVVVLRNLGTIAAARRAVLRSPKTVGRLGMGNPGTTAVIAAVEVEHNRTIISFGIRTRAITAAVEDNRRNRTQPESAERWA